MSLSLNLAIVFGVIEIVLGLSVSAQAQDVPDDINSARCVTRAPEGASTQELERFLDACFQCREEIIRNYNNRRLTANQMIEEYNRVVEQLREVTPLALEYQRRNTERANPLENQQLRLRQE